MVKKHIHRKGCVFAFSQMNLPQKFTILKMKAFEMIKECDMHGCLKKDSVLNFVKEVDFKMEISKLLNL